ncbi:MAG: HEPN domain-containing protein [candidate division KSB1 bacterium]|nr:HEPN domain-containing protein [candidate division KSB1 bacterium]MDZ7335975.1 HEPN domain-containing protein [candidate division KSB1 bacterium]MDZ7357941.1 HEPN domain-containing protein [candidate division KSB1 bacterium]MDZ7402196.1 HEPN domain-containing protein [candidate division KSB1 bacterium]
MTEDFRNDLIRYRIERAKETYAEAILLKQDNHWNACANRLYYACFYAVLALLEKHGFSSSKHSGIKSIFNQNFVKTGKISKEHGKLFNNLFDMRHEGDYIDFVYFTAEAIEPLIPAVNEFINTVANLLEQ